MLFAMIKRNLRLYFRDKASVFFSMLGVIIIIALYVLFLGSMLEGFVSEIDPNASRFFMDSWVMAGVVAAASITTTFAGFGTMIDDKVKKINRDFMVAPVSRAKLVFSYVLSSFIIGMIMTLFTFVLAQGYIVIYGGEFLSFNGVLKMLGLILLSVSASSAFVFFIACFVKTTNAFAMLSTLIGTFIGFLTGIYIPIGNLPDAVQWVIKVFPISHSATAMRQVMMSEAIDLSYIPENSQQFLGVIFKYGEYQMPFWGHLIVLFATFALFSTLSVVVTSRYKEK
jgi:multidrug/hemolysin transport system permease protein